MGLPDDKTWTWDQLMQVGCGGGLQGGRDLRRGVAVRLGRIVRHLVRQHGKELFTENGLGFDVAEAQAWFDLMVKCQKARAIGTPEQTSARSLPSCWPRVRSWSGRPPCSTTTPISWKRSTLRPAGRPMKMLRGPSLTGKATDRKTWYKASMLWSASSKTKNPDAAIAWINWFVNSPEAANIDLAERGIPANTEILAEVKPKLSPAQQTVAKYITDIKPRAGPDPDRSAARRRHDWARSCSATATDVLFGRSSTADAARSSWTKLKSNLQGVSHERHL